MPHCLGWLSGPDGPERVPSAVIDDIRQREADGEFDASTREGRYWAPRWLKPRAKVKITAGPLKGFAGEVWRITGSRRVAIWAQMLGRPSLVECAIDCVARAR